MGLGRWVTPAASVTIAAAAGVVLVVGQMDHEKTSHAAPEASMRADVRPALPAPAPAKLEAPVEPVVPRLEPRVERELPAPLTPPRIQDTPKSDMIATPRETKEALHAGVYLIALAKAPDLDARIAKLDELARTLPPEEAARVFSGLLDSELPGDLYSAHALRLAIVGRLGTVPGPDAEAVLLARIEPDRPRPERLTALEMLAARPNSGRARIEAVAQKDHDAVVQAKARWALARAR